MRVVMTALLPLYFGCIGAIASPPAPPAARHPPPPPRHPYALSTPFPVGRRHGSADTAAAVAVLGTTTLVRRPAEVTS